MHQGVLLPTGLEEVKDRQNTVEVQLTPIPVSIAVVACVTSRGCPHAQMHR